MTEHELSISEEDPIPQTSLLAIQAQRQRVELLESQYQAARCRLGAMEAERLREEAERNVERVLTFCKQLTWDIARLTDSLAMIEDILTPQEASTPPVVTPSVVTAVNIATKALVEQRLREAARDTAQELVDTDGCPRSAPARGRDVSGREGGR